ncbi:MAG: hypothetical protein HRT73_11080 [Flavobacteriales bacterium]|nr:hypothetical protein [Flavobacteriales bacterium]NQX98404.1 hypothetical protein [Flavobacteriales bacterium]
MKKEKIVFLALIIIMPFVLTSIIKLSDSKAICELTEIPSEEEQEAEKEDTINKFLMHNHFNIIVTEIKNLHFLENHSSTNSTIREVVTPPPELA